MIATLTLSITIVLLSITPGLALESPPAGTKIPMVKLGFLYDKQSFLPEEQAAYTWAKSVFDTSLLDISTPINLADHEVVWIAWAAGEKLAVRTDDAFIRLLKTYLEAGGNLFLTHFAPLLVDQLVEGEINPDNTWQKEFRGTGGGYRLNALEHPILRHLPTPLLLASAPKNKVGYFLQCTARYADKKPLHGKVLAYNIFGKDIDVVAWRCGKGQVIMATEWVVFDAPHNRAREHLEKLTEGLICSMAGIMPSWVVQAAKAEQNARRDLLLFKIDRLERFINKIQDTLPLVAENSDDMLRRKAQLARLVAQSGEMKGQMAQGVLPEDALTETLQMALNVYNESIGSLEQKTKNRIQQWQEQNTLSAAENNAKSEIFAGLKNAKDLYDAGLYVAAWAWLEKLDKDVPTGRALLSARLAQDAQHHAPFTYRHKEKSKFITYGIGMSTHGKAHGYPITTAMDEALAFYAKHGITHATLGLPQAEDDDLLTFHRYMNRNGIMPLALFLYQYAHEDLLGQTKLPAVKLDGVTLHPFLPCPANESWHKIAMARATELLDKRQAQGVCIEEISSSGECYCRQCRDDFARLYAETMPYDLMSGEYLAYNTKICDFKKRVFAKQFQALSQTIKQKNGKLAIWQMFDFMAPANDCWNDFTTFAKYVDIMLLETYYINAGASPFIMYSLPRADRNNTGRVYPALDFDETQATGLDIAQGMLYAFLGGANGIGQFGESRSAVKLWAGHAMGKVLFDAFYPGTVKVHVPRVALVIDNEGERAQLSQVAAQGWQKTLANYGVPLTLIRRKILTKGADAFTGKFEVLVVPDGLLLSDTDCDTLNKLCHRGTGLIITRDATLYREDGTQRATFGLPFLPEFVKAGRATGIRCAADEPKVSMVIDAPWMRNEQGIGGFYANCVRNKGASVVLAKDRTGNPVMLAGTHGRGRFCYLTFEPGVNAHWGYWENREHSNTNRRGAEWCQALLPLLTKWTAGGGAGPVEIISRPFGSEVYCVEGKNNSKNVLVLLNREKQEGTFLVTTLKKGVKVFRDARSGAILPSDAHNTVTATVAQESIRYLEF